MIICKDLDSSQQIHTLEEWFSKCPPEKGKVHWKDGRSAKELAKDWINNKGNSVLNVLNMHSDFRGLSFEKGSPELETRFDSYGRGRKHDFFVIGKRAEEKLAISIEAKVDESFGNDTVERYYIKSLLKKASGTNTNVTNRIEGLIKAIFKKPYPEIILGLQYQLLHAVAGTLTEARKQAATKAVFVVHTYKSQDINIGKFKDNEKALNNFITALSSGKICTINDGQVCGPFDVSGDKYIPSNIPLFIGKITT